MEELEQLRSHLRYTRNLLTREHEVWRRRYWQGVGGQLLLGGLWGCFAFDKVSMAAKGSGYLFVAGTLLGSYLAHQVVDRRQSLHYAFVATRNPSEWTEIRDGKMRILHPASPERRKNLKTIKLALLMGVAGFLSSALTIGGCGMLDNLIKCVRGIPQEKPLFEYIKEPKT